MTEKVSKSLLLDSGLSTKDDALVNPRHYISLKCDGDVSYGKLSLMMPCFLEKLLKIFYRYLYREPTQVVKESILR